MKIAIPTFSERYKAHVEAEQQYVSSTHQGNPASFGKRAVRSGDADPRPSAPAPTIEDAFRSARTENRSNPTSSH